MRSFSVGDEAVALPAGASALSRRTDVRCRDRHLFSLSQGPFRAYLYPVYTPSGVPVTSESPSTTPTTTPSGSPPTASWRSCPSPAATASPGPTTST